jgi:uncharacterized Fe-S center protein
VVASTDPVAIDQAAVDLVNQEKALPGCCLKENTGPGEDKFKGVYPKVDWEIQLGYAEKSSWAPEIMCLKKFDFLS